MSTTLSVVKNANYYFGKLWCKYVTTLYKWSFFLFFLFYFLHCLPGEQQTFCLFGGRSGVSDGSWLGWCCSLDCGPAHVAEKHLSSCAFKPVERSIDPSCRQGCICLAKKKKKKKGKPTVVVLQRKLHWSNPLIPSSAFSVVWVEWPEARRELTHWQIRILLSFALLVIPIYSPLPCL